MTIKYNLEKILNASVIAKDSPNLKSLFLYHAPDHDNQHCCMLPAKFSKFLELTSFTYRIELVMVDYHENLQ